MKSTSRLPQLLSETQRQKAIDEIINYFATERDEEIGIIAGEEILDAFLEIAGDNIYNRAIEDAKSFVKESIENLPSDIELQLKK